MATADNLPIERQEIVGQPIDHPASPSLVGAACRYLLSKGMYVTGTLDPAIDDGSMGDGNCWCGKTQHVLGQDDGLVARGRCVPGRACYLAR
jgi:hypothetical protein